MDRVSMGEIEENETIVETPQTHTSGCRGTGTRHGKVFRPKKGERWRAGSRRCLPRRLDMSNYHVHVYRVTDMIEETIDASDCEDAQTKALAVATERPIWHPADCSYIAIPFLEGDSK